MTNEVGKLLTAAEVAELLPCTSTPSSDLVTVASSWFFRVCKRGDRRFRYDDVIDFLRRAKYLAVPRTDAPGSSGRGPDCRTCPTTAEVPISRRSFASIA